MAEGQTRDRLNRTPEPDPTVLTTEQLLRAVRGETDLFNAKLVGLEKEFKATQESLSSMRADTREAAKNAVECLKEVIEARMNASDKAITLIQDAVDRSPSVTEVYAKFSEKFESIQTQFEERDTRTEQTSRDSKVAVDAALQAAKEAVGEQNKSSALAIAKSEAATTKQIDQIQVLIATMQKGLDDKFGTLQKGMDDKINDLKDRIGVIEKNGLNGITRIESHSKGLSDGWGYIVGAGGVVVALIAIISLLVKLGLH